MTTSLEELDAKVEGPPPLKAHIPLDAYYASTDKLFAAAKLAKKRGETEKQYILLMRFVRFLVEAMPHHPDYHNPKHRLVRVEYRQKAHDAINELAKIKEELAVTFKERTDAREKEKREKEMKEGREKEEQRKLEEAKRAVEVVKTKPPPVPTFSSEDLTPTFLSRFPTQNGGPAEPGFRSSLLAPSLNPIPSFSLDNFPTASNESTGDVVLSSNEALEVGGPAPLLGDSLPPMKGNLAPSTTPLTPSLLDLPFPAPVHVETFSAPATPLESIAAAPSNLLLSIPPPTIAQNENISPNSPNNSTTWTNEATPIQATVVTTRHSPVRPPPDKTSPSNTGGDGTDKLTPSNSNSGHEGQLSPPRGPACPPRGDSDPIGPPAPPIPLHNTKRNRRPVASSLAERDSGVVKSENAGRSSNEEAAKKKKKKSKFAFAPLEEQPGSKPPTPSTPAKLPFTLHGSGGAPPFASPPSQDIIRSCERHQEQPCVTHVEKAPLQEQAPHKPPTRALFSVSAIHPFLERPGDYTRGRRLVGLRNLGNTCWMNAVLQALFCSVPLTSYLLSNEYRNDATTSKTFADDFVMLLRILYSQGQRTEFEPYEYLSAFRALVPTLAEDQKQQDAHEGLTYTLDLIHESINRAVGRTSYREEGPESSSQSLAKRKGHTDSFVWDLFGGQLQSTLQCGRCPKSSKTFDHFTHLSLEIRETNAVLPLRACLQMFTTLEKVDWECPQCKQRSVPQRTLNISVLPPLLILHLKRFRQTIAGDSKKIETFVDFPVDGLNLDEFTSYKSRNPVRSYNLYAIVNQRGSLTSGHYTAFVRKAGRWFFCNDSQIFTVTSPREVVTSDAYLLFYYRHDLHAWFS